jgi:adenine-specific DNA methylase
VVFLCNKFFISFLSTAYQKARRAYKIARRAYHIGRRTYQKARRAYEIARRAYPNRKAHLYFIFETIKPKF